MLRIPFDPSALLGAIAIAAGLMLAAAWFLHSREARKAVAARAKTRPAATPKPPIEVVRPVTRKPRPTTQVTSPEASRPTPPTASVAMPDVRGRREPDAGRARKAPATIHDLRDYRSRQGEAGEARVRGIIDGAGHRALHDVVIPTANGNGTQIDHVVVVGMSVVCIETKNWSGHVTTSQTEPKWRQDVDQETRFLENPLLQNGYHAEQMAHQLGKRSTGFVGNVRQFVVMAGSASLSIGNHNRLLTADMLGRALDTVGTLGTPRDTEGVWARVTAVAETNAWTIQAHGTHPDNDAFAMNWMTSDGPSDHDLPTLH